MDNAVQRHIKSQAHFQFQRYNTLKWLRGRTSAIAIHSLFFKDNSFGTFKHVHNQNDHRIWNGEKACPASTMQICRRLAFIGCHINARLFIRGEKGDRLHFQMRYLQGFGCIFNIQMSLASSKNWLQTKKNLSKVMIWSQLTYYSKTKSVWIWRKLLNYS